MGHDHFSVASMSWCGHKHYNMTLQMENIIRQEHQHHSAGRGKWMCFHHSINQQELSKPEEPASGDHKKANRELLVEKKVEAENKASSGSTLARNQIQVSPYTSLG